MPKSSSKGLARVQIERRLASLRKVVETTRVRGGWISFMRDALGLSQRDLARLSGVAASTIAQAEQREKTGKITLEMVRKLANAIDCDLIYAVVPRQPIDALLRNRATLKAEGILRAADGHMSLEDQQVRSHFRERVMILADELIGKGDVW